MDKVIITGADGFIGSNLTRRLCESGIEVWAIIHPESKTKSRINNLSNVHCIESKLDELDKHSSKVPEGADAFYHLAWQGVNALERNNLELQMENITLGLVCVKFAANKKVKRFILPGSTSEYLYYGKPINEKALPSPQNAYGSVKIALRFLAKQYALQLSLTFIYVVITGIYAADRRDNNVIYYTIEKLLKSEKPSVTKLEQVWDYVNIKDVTNALMLIGDRGKGNTFYSVGHGDNWPLSQYIKIIHNYINPELPIGIGEVAYVNETLPSSCIDLTALKADTGFEPEVDFRDGIKEVIDTIREEICK